MSSTRAPQPDSWLDREISSLLETVDPPLLEPVDLAAQPRESAGASTPPEPAWQARRRSWQLRRYTRPVRRALRARRLELGLLLFGLVCALVIVWLVDFVTSP